MSKFPFVLLCLLSATSLANAQDVHSTPDAPRSPVLENARSVRPLMAIAGMQAWAITRQDGREEMALTTPDGLTIVGRVIGPQGQDLSAAILGAAPAERGSELDSEISAAPPPPADAAEITAMPAQTGPSAAPAQMAESASAPPAPVAASPDELLQQATTHAVWFSAGTPKPDAPVIYFLADPTCPHCAWATEKLAPQVRSGDLDLRVILAPIRNRDAVYQAASIIQSQTPASDFLSHELSQIGSTPSELEILEPHEINPDVVRGLQRNVAWARANGVKGVPFWIYQTADGVKLDFGAPKDAMLGAALPVGRTMGAAE